MIIDFHTHIFPDAVRENREDYFAGEENFQLLYESPKSKIVSAQQLVEKMDEQGVDRSVVFGFPWKNIQTCRANNDYILEAVAAYPDRLYGFCCIDPMHPGALAEAERCLNGGLCGLGELAFYDMDFTPAVIEQLTPIMGLYREADLPVLIHTNEPVGHIYPGKSPMSLKNLYDMVRAFPKNRLVLAHWGGGIFIYHLLKKEVKEAFANVYLDTAASPFLYDEHVFRIAVDIIGAEKILFGSDYPLLPPKRYFKQMEEGGLSAEEIRLISGDAASALLKNV